MLTERLQKFCTLPLLTRDEFFQILDEICLPSFTCKRLSPHKPLKTIVLDLTINVFLVKKTSYSIRPIYKRTLDN